MARSKHNGSKMNSDPLMSVANGVFVLLLSYGMFLYGLISSPVNTLLAFLVPLLASQYAFAYDKNAAELVSSTVFSTVLLPVFALMIVLLGAPVTALYSETLLTACHISYLVLLPLIINYGVDPKIWKAYLQLDLQATGLSTHWQYYSSVGGVVGAYIGAVPISFDWDRDWQRYPITIITGMYIGYGLTKILCPIEALFRAKPKSVKKH
ncbi:hypothetical protein CANCADRAFT_143062 [Tortispora caseinolytica NRRL Y-17796]|uniref:Glycosylphosphatidylinositol anchor biosynthesis protein 11 n=1 Tax=Tortispora caseinolytica NRRL Y-17796 TaxID=767744 RepID=A0A1E4TDD0_9ASCO|nr:hypothetical protein CANCADRAFT_143062 [Tortispora caseinolytica NRRL Y-17796]